MLGHLKLYVAFNLSLETLISRLKNIQLLIKRTSDGAEQIAKLQTLQEEIKAEAAEIKRELSAHTPPCVCQYRITEEAYAEKQAEPAAASD